MSASGLAIRKTYKLYIGGAFVRGESGRSQPALRTDGSPLDNFYPASRKDLRDAVTAARGAFDGWASRTAYLRGQILYRAAEMLQGRATELADEISRSTGTPKSGALAEVAATIDRLVYYAGWADKYAQVFGCVNPVATPHFNFTVPEPTGVVAVLAPDEPALVALVSLLAPVLVSGNTAVVLASERHPLPALTFAEVLATCDLPGGAANVLSGRRADLASHLAGHMDINAIVDGSGAPEIGKALRTGTAHNLKRYAARTLNTGEWLGERSEDPYWILDTIELKTAWHPIGL
jgi:acyl-CoA reductase-like NAD-dependent aldehyde dehydrogenase